MKLQNKKTGEIAVIAIDPNHSRFTVIGKNSYLYDSLAELNEEWEDYEEPKEYWFIDIRYPKVEPKKDINLSNSMRKRLKEIGNYFETKEEAEKAVEKLKAWKRLKEQGFKFKTFQRSPQGTYDIYANWEGYMPPLSWMIDKDLNLLFGGEE